MPQYNDYHYSNFSGVSDQRRGLLKTYTWMFFGLLLTAATSYLMYTTGLYYSLIRGPIPLLLVLIQFGIAFGFSAALNRATSSTMKLLFVIFAITMGISLTSIGIVYSLGTIFVAFLVSAVYFACLIFIGMTTKRDLSSFGTICLGALVALIITQAILMLFRFNMNTRLISIVGLLIFTGLTAWDVQRANQLMSNTSGMTQEKFAIFMALELYLDFINIFLYILRLLGMSSSRNN
ncbi:hypothetical protein C815_00960 [Firmicutes bacterium M10-2]|nr:hypothetical protein C815_00960 [Firmicutes bacterium M10-2]